MSKNKDCVIHHGVVEEVMDSAVMVNIVSMAACASCQLNGVCSASDIEKKSIEVQKPVDRELTVGESVTLEMEESLGMKAVLLGYIYPFLILLASLIIFTMLNIEEGIAALISVGLMIPYYVALYLSKDKMKKNFVFRIK
ncbi:MAG: SoxR reducing system RseC family protein [Bacteroidota bacterium]|nr:SoxR reducing system RseC family protein [Bacteroidota bacterium]